MTSEGELYIDFTVPVIKLPDVNALKYGKVKKSGGERPLIDFKAIPGDYSKQQDLEFDWYVDRMDE